MLVEVFKHSKEKLKVDSNTSDVLSRFNAVPLWCFNDVLRKDFAGNNYLNVKSSGSAIIIAEVIGKYITYHRYEV